MQQSPKTENLLSRLWLAAHARLPEPFPIPCQTYAMASRLRMQLYAFAKKAKAGNVPDPGGRLFKAVNEVGIRNLQKGETTLMMIPKEAEALMQAMESALRGVEETFPGEFPSWQDPASPSKALPEAGQRQYAPEEEKPAAPDPLLASIKHGYF